MKKLALFLSYLLTACSVGPNYKTPEISLPAHWLSASEDEAAPNAAELAYWQKFHDPVLDQLITRAMENNFDLQIAQRRIDAARAQLEEATAALLPRGGLSATAERQANRVAFPGPFTFNKPFNTYQAGFDASWELDLFGRAHRELEARAATLQASEASAGDMRVSLLAEIARTYINIRAAQAQLSLARATQSTYEKNLSIAAQRFKAGEIPGLEVTQAQALLDQAQTQIPYNENLVSSAELSMDVLLGEHPGVTHQLTAVIKPIPLPPAEIVLQAPSRAIADRPDLRISERQLAAATARQGESLAAFFPDLSLSGFLGLLNTEAGNLVQSNSRSWSGRGNVLLPIFNYGTLSAQLHSANATQAEALATYRKALIAALSDVERTVSAYQHQQEYRTALQKTVAQNEKAATVVRQRYKAGLSSYLEVLDAERTLYASQTQSTQADALYAQNVVAVYKSLGGGWQASNATAVKEEIAQAPKPEKLGQTELPTK